MNTKQKYDLIRTLLSTMQGSTFHAIKASQLFNDRWGLSFDWHMFSDVLDIMQQIGLASIVGHSSDGMTIYTINPL